MISLWIFTKRQFRPKSNRLLKGKDFQLGNLPQ